MGIWEQAVGYWVTSYFVINIKQGCTLFSPIAAWGHTIFTLLLFVWYWTTEVLFTLSYMCYFGGNNLWAIDHLTVHQCRVRRNLGLLTIWGWGCDEFWRRKNLTAWSRVPRNFDRLQTIAYFKPKRLNFKQRYLENYVILDKTV